MALVPNDLSLIATTVIALQNLPSACETIR